MNRAVVREGRRRRDGRPAYRAECETCSWVGRPYVLRAHARSEAVSHNNRARSAHEWCARRRQAA